MVIYKITNKINNKVYIGQTIKPIQHRWNQHIKSIKYKHRACEHLKNAMLKHGIENFEIEVIEHASSIEELNLLERYYIAAYNSIEKGYNLTSGGKNGTPSPELRKKLSEAHKKQDISYLHTPEIREKIRKKLIGKTYSNKGQPRISSRSKEVCVNGNVYPTVSMAARAEGINLSTLDAVVHGRKNSKKFTAFFTNKN